MANRRYTVVVAVNNDRILDNNLFQSPELKNRPEAFDLMTQRDCRSAPVCYNAAIERSSNDLVVFMHQDLYLPDRWFAALGRSLDHLHANGVEWGVLGSYGVTDKGMHLGRVYTHAVGIHGQCIDKPEIVQTLDEIVLVIRKSSGLRFDERLPHFHLYGTDICLRAQELGMPCYAVPTFCIHNTNQYLSLPREYYACYRFIKRKWREHLPIHSSCLTISRFDVEANSMRLKALVRGILRPSLVPICREDDPFGIIERIPESEFL